MLYGSGYEAFLPRSAAGARRPRPVRVVGKHCESGRTFVVPDAYVPDDLVVGDILATPVTGAYGYVMASNYNKVPRPAVVFVLEGWPASPCAGRPSRTWTAPRRLSVTRP